MNRLKLFSSFCFLLVLASCSNNESSEEKITAKVTPHEELSGQIKTLEAEMHKSPAINNVIAGQALTAYSNFASMFPEDSLTPDYLFKAGEIATATTQYPQALQYYQSITTKYPDYKYAQESLYLQGMLLDNYLNQDDKAKIIYEQVISKYPESSYATDAKSAIKNLGKSDEELIKEFQKKNGEK